MDSQPSFRADDASRLAVTPLEYDARVQVLLPGIASRTREAIESRQLPPASFAQMREAGLFKVFQPRRWGGLELPPMSFFKTIFELSRVCPSTGWVYGVLGPHNWEVAALAEQAQVDVWGEEPGTTVSSSFAPMGNVKEVDGGYVLNGTWKYSSGSAGCTWVLLGGAVARPGRPPDVRNFLLPRADYEIVDTWQTMGLRGTGSNDIVVRDAFVPAHRSNSLEELYYLRSPGRAVNTGPLYRLPFMALFAPLLSYAALGAAKGAHEHFVKYISEAAGKINKGYDLAEEGATHLRLASSISDIESSYQLLSSLIDEMYQCALDDREIPLLLRKRIRFEAANSVDRAMNAALEIFKASGTSVINTGNPIQQYVLDIMSARTHIANNRDRIATLYARELVGVSGSVKAPADFLC